MNTQPIVVPVFAVEAAIKALKDLQPMFRATEESNAALAVLEQLLKEGPVPMPKGAYDALYDMLAADPETAKIRAAHEARRNRKQFPEFQD